MRIAIIADIHGNVLALEAVLADIKMRRPDVTIDLGDSVSGPLWPAETVALLETFDLRAVRGNHDRMLAETPRALMGPSDSFAFDRLDAKQRERLGALPERLALTEGVLAFHGTPKADVAYLLDDIVDGRLVQAGPKAIKQRLDGAHASLLLCGHSHQPRLARSSDGATIVNPGSVGCPGYMDDTSPRHVSEAGSPHARYAIATRTQKSWAVELIALDYDWMRAARTAEENGRPEWARALATGFVR